MYDIGNNMQDVRKARRKTQVDTTCRLDQDPVEFPVYELSAHGFSFLCERESCFFKKGAIFEKIKIINGEKLEIISGAGRVVHVAEFDVQKMRIGVSYTQKTLDRTVTGKIRIPRRIPKISLQAQIERADGRLFNGLVRDYTASAARIGFIEDTPAGLQEGDEITVVIATGDQNLFEGGAYVLRRRDDGNDLIIGFCDQLLDVAYVETISNTLQQREIITSAFESLKKYTAIRPDYKALICDWRMFFSRLKTVLDQEESKNRYRLPSEQELFMGGIEGDVHRILQELIARLNPLAENLSSSEGMIYKEYFRENLNPFFRHSPFCCSVIDKDLGYAGDFETIKQFFQNPYAGDSLFGKLLNKLVLNFDAVTAHQARVNYLYDELQALYRTCREGFSFLVLGAGPAEEVLRFVETNTFAKPVRATLLDMDAYALADFSERLQYLPKNNFVIDLVNINILNILKKTGRDPIAGTYDLAYCAGLFDYFKDNICKRLTQYLIKHTSAGGTVIITNVHTNNKTRYVMDYCGGWDIIHRNEAQMDALVPRGYPARHLADEMHANLFLKLSIPES